MPRNSQGLYTLPLPPVRAGELVESAWANTTLDDLASAMTGSLPRTGDAPMIGPLQLSADPITQQRQAASKEYVDQFMAFSSGMFVGALAYAPISIEPPGWLLCDGRAVSRTIYDTLFAAIGTMFGAGDGSTTFNLPNQAARYLRGTGPGELLGQLLDDSLKSHIHPLSDPGHTHAATQAAHGHTITTGNHTHGVNDPGHVHADTRASVSGGGSQIDSGGSQLVYGNSGSAVTGISIATAGNLGGSADSQTPAITVPSSVTGATIGADGEAETRPKSIVSNMFIKAKNDSTGTPTVTGITSSDAQMINIGNSNPVSPELLIQSNVAFGIPKLDASGKIQLNQMPMSTFNALGFFDASTGNNPSQEYPTTTFNSGDTYIVSVTGTILVFDPVTLVSSMTLVAVGSLLQYVTGSITNPTGWYSVAQSSTIAASSVIFAPTSGISATNVQDAIVELDTEKAPLASPAFTGNPTAPTPTVGDNDTSIATTAFVQTAVAGVSAPSASTVSFVPGGGISATNVQDAIDELDAEKAPISALTAIGTSFSPTGSIGATNVQAAIQELDAEKLGVTMPAASVAANGVNQAAIAVNVVGKGPAFRAVAVGGQALTNGTAAQLNLNTEEFDTNNFFSTAPNRFQPTIAGYYQLNACVAVQGTTINAVFAQIRKNGVQSSAALPPQPTTTSSTNAAIAISDLVYLNGSTDYVELWGGCSGSGSLTIQLPTPYPTTFSGFLARGA